MAPAQESQLLRSEFSSPHFKEKEQSFGNSNSHVLARKHKSERGVKEAIFYVKLESLNMA